MTQEQIIEYVNTALDKTLEELRNKSVGLEFTDDEPSVFDSKFGGVPYLPSGAKIPYDADGNQMRFILQIKCSDVQGIKYFPQKGMLQFWINPKLSDNEGKVIYYNDITEDVTVPEIDEFIADEEEPEIDEYIDEEEENVVLDGEAGIRFKPAIEDNDIMSVIFDETFCKHFNQLTGENLISMRDVQYNYNLPDDIIGDMIRSGCCDSGHKIGGAPVTCQGDPRFSEDEVREYNFQLLQLTSDDYVNWVDSGSGHFFINLEKLKKLDFSDVCFTWTCC